MSHLFLSLQVLAGVVTSISPGIRAPVYSNIFELPAVTVEPDTDTTLPWIQEDRVREHFQPIFEMEESLKEILDNSLEEKEELPRTNKALLKSYVEHHSGTGQEFVNSKHLANDDNHLDKALDILDQLNGGPNVTVDSSGRRCVDKVMMREETEYDEIMTCIHDYDNRCHTTYVTVYEPHQEEECDEKFKKECDITYEDHAVSEKVEECRTSFVPDCDLKEQQECQTVFDTECTTRQKVHNVTEHIPECLTVNMTKCRPQTVGLVTEERCEVWPVQRCEVKEVNVVKTTPETKCEKVGRRMCPPPGCGLSEGPVECQEKMRDVIISNPVEECHMNPIKTCKMVTKLVPGLKPVQECVDVPKEVCATNRVNPHTVKRPSIMKWCYTPDQECKVDPDCPVGVCEQGTCVQCREDLHCDPGYSCANNQCFYPSGKVLVSSITVHCSDCPELGVRVTLAGERSTQHKEGIPCTTATISLKDSRTEFNNNRTLGTCFKAPLNSRLTGGRVVVEGDGGLDKGTLCVEWLSNDNFAISCHLEEEDEEEKTYRVVRCEDLADTRCSGPIAIS